MLYQSHKVNGCQVPTQLMPQKEYMGHAPFHVSTCYMKTNFVTFLVFLERKPCNTCIIMTEKSLRYANKSEKYHWEK